MLNSRKMTETKMRIIVKKKKEIKKFLHIFNFFTFPTIAWLIA